MLPLSPGRAERHGLEYYRHGTLSLYVALSTATGEIIGPTPGIHPLVAPCTRRSTALCYRRWRRQRRSGRRTQRAWRSINWTRLDEARFYELIDQLRGVIAHDAAFWTIEDYRQPSDSVEVAYWTCLEA